MLSVKLLFVHSPSPSRHVSILCPTPQSCFCRKVHSDAKPLDPFTLAQKDLTSLYDDIKKVFSPRVLSVSDRRRRHAFPSDTRAHEQTFLHSQELFVSKEELKSLCHYYFDGKGKAIRPIIVILMARALNVHSNKSG